MTENWRPVADEYYSVKYMVSDHGRVAAVRRLKQQFETVLRIPQILKPGGSPYKSVILYRNGSGKTYRVHNLVLEAFVGPRPPGWWCAHNDGNPFNNRLENLRWDTPANNQADKRVHGTHSAGVGNAMAKLTEEDVFGIRKLRANGESLMGIARLYGVSPASIANIMKGKTWTHLP